MSDVVIRAESIGKKYMIGHQAEGAPYATLRESMSRTLRRFRRNARDMARGRALVMGDDIEEFWALKDVDFEIRRGEVVGVIGRNGAGKSTLLKVLSRITEPSEGRVTIEGRVASLLEVGTGFHPELSGRENIFLNGSILGMTRKEIQAKFDEIVEFAGVEKFIDTPVKRYSSGMQVRLGFAVAAHLEPEILVVDEVLAVGDATFQKKCLGKMQDVAGKGRTVLFVSHNMSAVRQLCSSAIYLSDGGVDSASHGDLEALQRYASDIEKDSSNIWKSTPGDFENEYFWIKGIEASVSLDGGVLIYIEGSVKKQSKSLQLAIGIYDNWGNLLFVSSDKDVHTKHHALGDILVSVNLPSALLNKGSYRAVFACYLHNQEELVSMANGPGVVFEVNPEFTDSPFWLQARPGILAPKLKWVVK